MGHRKHNAPRRGSLAFFPRARHQILVPRVRNWTFRGTDKPSLAGYPAIKVGMIHAITVDDRERTPNFGKPTFSSATVLSLPDVHVYGIRAYAKRPGDGSSVALGDYFASDLEESVRERLAHRGSKKNSSFENEVLPKAERISALVGVNPSDSGLAIKRPQVQEIALVGGNPKSQFEFAKGLLGKAIKTSEFLKAGAFVDTIAITKGKGFEGPVTRMGIKRKQHKSRKSVRAVGVISPWHPATVMYTVPRAGQMGFHQRVCLNNRVLYVGNGAQTPITPAGGFLHFGEVRGDFVVLRGSVPGPSKRLVDLRLPLNPRRGKIKEPRIIEFNISGHPMQQLVQATPQPKSSK